MEEFLINQGFLVTAAVLRMESWVSKNMDDLKEEFLADVIKENYNIIMNLVSNNQENHDSSLLEKISGLLCPACNAKKAKNRIVLKKKQQQEPKYLQQQQVDRKDEMIVDIESSLTKTNETISLVSMPLSTNTSSSPRKQTKGVKKPSLSSGNGPLLSRFFQVLPKEMEKEPDKNSPNSANNFWSYFPPFFVKPNVIMAPLKKKKDIKQDGDLEAITSSLPLVRFKLIHFAENIRPCYFGTFSKKSTRINGRRPFVKDNDLDIDYEVNSDDEWEDACDDIEGEIENLSDQTDSDDENEEDDDDEEDSTWVVPHGYLSEDEMMGDDDIRYNINEDPDDPITRRRLQESWRSNTNTAGFLNKGPKLIIFSQLDNNSCMEQEGRSKPPFMRLIATVEGLEKLKDPYTQGLIIDPQINLIRGLLPTDQVQEFPKSSKKRKKLTSPKKIESNLDVMTCPPPPSSTPHLKDSDLPESLVLLAESIDNPTYDGDSSQFIIGHNLQASCYNERTSTINIFQLDHFDETLGPLPYVNSKYHAYGQIYTQSPPENHFQYPVQPQFYMNNYPQFTVSPIVYMENKYTEISTRKSSSHSARRITPTVVQQAEVLSRSENSPLPNYLP